MSMTDDNPSENYSAKQVHDIAAGKWVPVPKVTTAKQIHDADNKPYEASHNLNQFSSPGREIYMHNTSTEKHYVNMMAVHDGLPQGNPVGLMALLEAQISKAMEDVLKAQAEFKAASESLHFHRSIEKDHHEDLTEGLQQTNTVIDQLQAELDDYIPDSVFPAYLITPSADAYDEGVAKDFFAHIFDSYEGEEGYFEFEKLVLLQAHLRDAYSDRQGWLEWDKKQVYDINHKAMERAYDRFVEARDTLAKYHMHYHTLLSHRTGALDHVDPAKIRAEGRVRVQSGQEAEAFNGAVDMLQQIGTETQEYQKQIASAQATAENVIAQTVEYEEEMQQKTAVRNAALEKATRDPLLDAKYRQSVKQQIQQDAAANPTDARNYDRSVRLFGESWADFAQFTRPATLQVKRRTHVRNNFALRGGVLLENNVVRIIPIQRENESGNTILCMLPEYDNVLVTLAIDMNSKYKWIITTVLNQYPEWTPEAENETDGVPTGVTDNEDETAENCLGYHKLIMTRLRPIIEERLAQANVTDMMGITMNDPATNAVWD